MVKLASRDVVPIMVDCTKGDRGGARQAILERYRVAGYPAIVMLDPDGKVLGNLQPTDTVPAQLAAVVARVKEAEAARAAKAAEKEPDEPARKAKPAPARRLVEPQRGAPIEPVEATIEDGLAQARERGRFLAVLFTDTPEADPETVQLLERLRAPDMSSLPEKFLWIRRPLEDERGEPTAEAEAHLARRAPTLVLFDPWVDPPREEGARFPSAAAVKPKDDPRAKIERMVLDAARAGHPPPPRRSR